MKLKEWEDELIWCPSQCYYYFITESGRRFCIYLRWRHSDPWTADLVEFFDDKWDWDKTRWNPISTDRDYKDFELEELKKSVLKSTIKMFKSDKIKKKGDC